MLSLLNMDEGDTMNTTPGESLGKSLKGAFILRQARADMGLTQSQLASILGVHTRTVGRWEAGDSMPTAAQFGCLRIVLHLPGTTWLTEEERTRLMSAWEKANMENPEMALTKDKYHGGER